MSEADREKWDQRYRDGEYEARTWPSEVLTEWAPRVSPGRALDVACGAGRNALWLAQHGWRVDAVDISETALGRARHAARERGLDVAFHRSDLDAGTLPGSGYDLAVVARFLDRALVPRIRAALGPDGWIVYDHHVRTRRPVAGPGDRFRLAPNELLELFRGFRVVHYDEGLVEERDGRTMALARLVACKGDPGF